MKTKFASAVLSVALTGAIVAAIAVPVSPAQAIIVFDPSNYTQNLLTAARTLAQINNQIRMLQNQAQSLINQAKNLATIGFPELQALQQTIQQIDALMAQAKGIQFQVATLNQQFRAQFPASFNQALNLNQQVIAAKGRFTLAMDAYEQTMTVQAQVVENITADAVNLNGIVARSQNAQGALQASQATNQLLALVAKQQFQIQQLMAAQYRADAIDRAAKAQSQLNAQGATAKFLGTGTAYTTP
jgi:P-type conjugative transfer protein TrbJ